MNWRHTHVWEINRQLVVADTVEEAISIYRMYSERGILSEPITIQQIGNSDTIGKDYSAIMGYEAIPHHVGESGTSDIDSIVINPKPIPTDNKPIDIMDVPASPSIGLGFGGNTSDTTQEGTDRWAKIQATQSFYGD